MGDRRIIGGSKLGSIKAKLRRMSLKSVKPIMLSTSVLLMTNSAIAATKSVPFDLPTHDITTTNVQKLDGYHKDQRTMFFSGDIKKFLNFDFNPYEYSIYLNFKNPIAPSTTVEGGFNLNYAPTVFYDQLYMDKKSTGSFWSKDSLVPSAFLKVDNTKEAQLAKDEKIKHNLYRDITKKIIPDYVASTNEEINYHIDTINELDWKFTLAHELFHSNKSTLTVEDTQALILSKDKYKDLDINSDEYKTLHTQIRESYADVGGILYLIKHNLIPENKIASLIKGQTLRRIGNNIWHDKNPNTYSRIGDIAHDTVPALLSLLNIYLQDNKSFDNISNIELSNLAENIVRKTFSENKTFLVNKEMSHFFYSKELNNTDVNEDIEVAFLVSHYTKVHDAAIAVSTDFQTELYVINNSVPIVNHAKIRPQNISPSRI